MTPASSALPRLPLSAEQAANATDFLVRQGHTRNTAKCARGLNTPLWQYAVRCACAHAVAAHEGQLFGDVR